MNRSVGMLSTVMGVVVVGLMVARSTEVAATVRQVPSAGPHAQGADSGSTIAVLPFVNISADPADEWMGNGIAETVATSLEAAGGSGWANGP